MGYYTQTIPLNLAEKLKEKGMPMEVWNGTTQGMPYIVIMEKSSFDWLDKELCGTPQMVERRYTIPTYAEVFDWLMEKGVFIFGFRRFDNWRWAYSSEWRFRIELEDISQESVNGYLVNGKTWHEAANAAIEKALELIKEK